jgi:hypothetical protein
LIDRFRPSRRTVIVLDCMLLVLMTAVLIRPLFKAKYLDKWASIESTFISDARYLNEHWPHPQWQPLWYGGTRFDYIYPPALRYGTAWLSRTFGWVPVKAYHIYTAFFYCVGIAGAYLLIRVGSRSRRMALLGGVATALMSPCLLFLRNFRADAWKRLPVRLGVLAKYGEGPHMTALALIPFALAFTWRALDRKKPLDIALAAIFSAAVVSNNFYGATALATFYPILLWSFWITRQDRAILYPALAIPSLAYGLTAFWLVPSYFRITSENMKYVSEHGTTWSIWVAVGVAIVFALATDRFAKGRPGRTWAVFVTGCVIFFALNTLGNAWFNFRISGEPSRLVPELDYVFIMGAVTLLGWIWTRRGLTLKAVSAVVVALAFFSTAGYIRNAWNMFPLAADYQGRPEYRIPDWIAKNMPDARAFVNGSVRFWFNAWHDIPQLGGGSEQGLLNGASVPAAWDLSMGPSGQAGLLWMQSFGVDLFYVSDQRSQEMYKDITHPKKFEGLLPVVFDDQRGNFLYLVPRRWRTRARVVETAKLDACPKPRFNDDVDHIRQYAAVMENGPDSPVALERPAPESIRLRARVAPGQSIVVQESYDTPWEARAGGQLLTLRKDVMGQMVIEAPPGEHDISLAFVTPMENIVGRWLTVLTVLGLIAMMGYDVFARRRA